MAMTFEPCPWRTRPSDVIGEPCKNCGHSNLVHPGHANPDLQVCVICELLYTRIKLEEQRSPVMHITVSQEGMDNIKATIPLSDEALRQERADRLSRDPMDDGPISDEAKRALMAQVRTDDGPAWHMPVDHTQGREMPSATLRSARCMVCDGRLVPDPTEKHWVHEDPKIHRGTAEVSGQDW
jgi:hypothetical protein